MIIYISLEKDAFQRDNVPYIDRLVHEIVDIYIKGRHLIVVERETIERIRATTTLNRHAEVVLNDLYSFYSQTKGMVKTSPVSLQVLSVESDLGRRGSIFEVGLKKFIEYDLSRETKLLVENKLNDGQFLAIALQRLATRNRLGKLTFDIGHGGGDDMPALFQAEIDDRRITVCVADSDRKFPHAQISDKCRKLNKKLKSSVGSVVHYVELPCHEAENMIPLSSLSELPLPPEHLLTLTKLQQIEKKEIEAEIPVSERLKLFFDFKNGVLPEKMIALRGTSYGRYLREKFELIGIDITKEAVHGLGDHLTRRLTEEGKAIADFCQKIFSCPYWKDIFSDALSNLLYFLLGGQKRVAM
ncbi:hypothetical protein G6M02_14370 [Agrobacterium rhizogenes]|nr:hypothetical protein [Rhizobium rhizogenes]